MFPNSIECLGHLQKRNKTTTNKQRKTKEKINKSKMGIIAPVMNNYPKNG